jgi:hypothetical protein
MARRPEGRAYLSLEGRGKGQELHGEAAGIEGAVQAVWIDVEGLVDDADGGPEAFVLADEVQLGEGLFACHVVQCVENRGALWLKSGCQQPEPQTRRAGHCTRGAREAVEKQRLFRVKICMRPGRRRGAAGACCRRRRFRGGLQDSVLRRRRG